jgi:hypothetical protein
MSIQKAADKTIARCIIVHRLKWVIPAILWIVLTLAKIVAPSILENALYWQVTFSVFSFYLGAWSSEYLISKMAEIYYKLAEQEEELPDEVKKWLTTLSVFQKLRGDENR